jgi:hypothetical protein
MAGMERLIFIFVDGCGVGRAQAGNPFFHSRSRHLPFWQGAMTLPDGTPIKAIDATLGLPGAPQSASGQTALFCGVGAHAIAHRHHHGYPDQLLRRVILEKNLLSLLAGRNVTARYLNAYPGHDELFGAQHVRIEADGRFWFSPTFPDRFKRLVSVTSCMMLASGQRPFAEEDIRAGHALYQDFSNRQLIERGFRLPEFTPEQAAQVLHGASRRFDFILYEYFLTDLYAHRKSFAECVALVGNLDRLLGALLGSLDRGRDTLILTSDHGNLEDHSLRGHSRNPVPLIAWGRHGAVLRDRIESISDVAPAILELA